MRTCSNIHVTTTVKLERGLQADDALDVALRLKLG